MRAERGEITFKMIFSFLILSLAYLSDPQAVNHFVAYLLNDIFGQLHKSFGGHVQTVSTGTTSTTPAPHGAGGH
jgi:hypothetical protein